MRCAICGKESGVICLCGFCPDCIEEHTHEGCSKIYKKKLENERDKNQ